MAYSHVRVMGRGPSRREFLGTGVGVLGAAVLGGCAHSGLPAPVPAAADCATGVGTFSNWAGTITCRPARYCQPRSEAEVVRLVKDAIANGQHVRTVGAGHSWAPLVLTHDTLVNLDRIQALVALD